jgi:hypothetical protein
VPHRLSPFAPASPLPDFGAVAYWVPATLLIIAVTLGGWPTMRFWMPGMPSLDPGEAVWLPRSPDLVMWPDGSVHAWELRSGSEGEVIEALLREVARRDDDLGLVLAAPSDVPYARVLDVMEAAQAAGVRRAYLMADVRREPLPTPVAEEPSP